MDKLSEIRARHEAATPGPWFNFGDWLVHTILQVHRECGNVTAMQNFVSVEELKRLWKEW